MKDHLAIMAGLGIATMIMAWLPAISKKIKVSYPIILLGVGAILWYIELPLIWPDPFWPDQWLMYISEIIVIVSLMGAGLKIGRDYSLESWKTPLRLIFFTMPLCMIAVYFLGVNLLSLSVPGAILLAAALAPTDPVLAAEVQIDDLKQKENNHAAQFALTGEAGINDGLAFPFTFLAIAAAKAGSFSAVDLQTWFLDKFLLKIILGVLIGYGIGLIFGKLYEFFAQKMGIKNPHGFIALSVTFTAYGLTELLHGYGFLAVFVAALCIRYTEKTEEKTERKMNSFTEEFERLLLVFWLILFGGALLNGVLDYTDWRGVVFALLLILVIRPVAGMLSLSGMKKPFREKLAVSFFGIRGIGSIFYLSWAFLQTDLFEEKTELYAIAALVILISIIIHGLSAPHLIDFLEKGKKAE